MENIIDNLNILTNLIKNEFDYWVIKDSKYNKTIKHLMDVYCVINAINDTTRIKSITYQIIFIMIDQKLSLKKIQLCFRKQKDHTVFNNKKEAENLHQKILLELLSNCNK